MTEKTHPYLGKMESWTNSFFFFFGPAPNWTNSKNIFTVQEKGCSPWDQMSQTETQLYPKRRKGQHT